MEPCLYRQGEGYHRGDTPGGESPQWSPAFIGRESVGCAAGGCGPPRRNGALPLSAGRGLLAAGDPGVGGSAAMEPCLYRQGEAAERTWQAARLAAAMEPCLYRQGE